MIECKNASADMVDDVAALCNLVFRKTEKPEHNDMHLQFPLMLSEKNANNLMVAVDGNGVVAHLGTSLTPMIIDDVEIPYGQIGAVCTHLDYRQKGLGTKLLVNAFENFKANNVNLITISGGRGLYRRNSAVDLGCVGMFESEPSAVTDNGYDVEFYEDGQIGLELIDVYNRESSKYKRSAEEFQILVDAMPKIASRPQPFTAVARENGKCVAYVSGAKVNNLFKTMEFGGNAEVVLELVRQIACKLDIIANIWVQNIDPRYDYFVKNSKLMSMSHLPDATFMILDPEKFYNQLRGLLANKGLKEYSELPLDIYGAKNEGIALANYLFNSFNPLHTSAEEKAALPLMLPDPHSYNYI